MRVSEVFMYREVLFMLLLLRVIGIDKLPIVDSISLY